MAIETKRLILRSFHLEDAHAMFVNWASRDNVSKYLSWNTYTNEEDVLEYLKKTENRPYKYAIELKEIHEVIGSIDLVDLQDGTGSIGYCLSDTYWSQGIMTEALKALITYLFDHDVASAICAFHHENNIASGKVMQKSGMRFVKVVDKDYPKMGHFKACYYEIDKKNFALTRFVYKFNDYFCESVGYHDTLERVEEEILDKGYHIKKAYTYLGVNHSQISCFRYFINKNDCYLNYLISKDEDELEKIMARFYLDNKDYFYTKREESLEETLSNLLREKSLKISFAESCTGGLLTSSLISIPGASDLIESSFVTYSEAEKVRILGVDQALIDQYSVYSKEVANAMVEGLFLVTKADVCVAVTGLSGSSNPNKNDGSFDFAIKYQDKVYLKHFKVSGARNEVRIKQKNYIFFWIIRVLSR